MHFGIHNDDQNQKGFSLVKETGKKSQGLKSGMRSGCEPAELSFSLSRILGQEHTCEQVRRHGPNFKACFFVHFAYSKD